MLVKLPPSSYRIGKSSGVLSNQVWKPSAEIHCDERAALSRKELPAPVLSAAMALGPLRRVSVCRPFSSSESFPMSQGFPNMSYIICGLYKAARRLQAKEPALLLWSTRQRVTWRRKFLNVRNIRNAAYAFHILQNVTFYLGAPF